MKILHCHNFYQQIGGEDISYELQVRMLREHGHEVLEYTLHNDEIDNLSRYKTARLSFWNSNAYKQVAALVRKERPQLMHCTNTFPLISPSVYYAARTMGIPVLQSLHNYRPLCPGWAFHRNGGVCEDCLHAKFAWPAILHGCYRDSRSASAVTATMHTFHALLGTWKKAIDMYVTPSRFARSKYIEGGYPGEKIEVLHNFIDPDLGMAEGTGGYVIFVGRLSREKGIELLLKAWKQDPDLPDLMLVGDGPLSESVRAVADQDRRISWLGYKPLAQVRELIGNAAMLVMPSVYYETFGRTLIEAYSMGTPVVAARLGAMAELVVDSETGCLFEAGDAGDLRDKITRLWRDLSLQKLIRSHARKAYLEKFTADVAYVSLMKLYRKVIDTRPGI